MPKFDKSVYYDFGPVRSRNAVYNFIAGGRGIGKTFGAKTICVNDYLNKGEQFIYLRRFNTDLKTRGTFFADIAHQWPQYGFRVNGMLAEVCRNPEADKPVWETMGYFMALSNAQNKKSVSYPKVTKIIFDEFIIEKGVVQYLKNEARVMLDLYSTVDRYEDRVKVFFLANAVSIMNPYFLEYNIQPKKGQEWVRSHNGFICCHFPDDEKFKSEVRNTRFGQFIAGTEYEDYSVNNEFFDNNGALIEKKAPNASYAFTLEFENGQSVSVWYDTEGGVQRFFVQAKRPKTELLLTLAPERMREGVVLLHYGDKIPSTLRTAFRHGRMYFDTATTRNNFIQIFKRK